MRLRSGRVDPQTLGEALRATCEKRNSALAVAGRRTILAEMRRDAGFAGQWGKYASKHAYAGGISFSETLDAVEAVADVAACHIDIRS